MDKHIQQHDRVVKLVFGPEAEVSGTLGSGRGPGHIAIVVDHVHLGDGPTFAEALQSASMVAARLVSNPSAGIRD